MKWRQFHRDAFERWEKRGGKNYSLIGDQLERIFMGGINIVIVYYINTRGKLHTGKWCRVKEAGNRLTPGGHSNNSYVRVEFRGGGEIEEVWRFSLRKLPPNQPWEYDHLLLHSLASPGSKNFCFSANGITLSPPSAVPSFISLSLFPSPPPPFPLTRWNPILIRQLTRQK